MVGSVDNIGIACVHRSGVGPEVPGPMLICVDPVLEGVEKPELRRARRLVTGGRGTCPSYRKW